ncbi:unnamed protein product [Rotaria magnacalcarata]|nr:unnamed protein product [Rotaria magnacalcarata]CAF1602565.1 unnamed protein product [Rotaria magnacalcarata]CAF2096704.1 unnamed protein product [Rotaria magnacalcarata]CAF2260370.1 unnamed protein product [Rotaria magnacalcarata]CAF3910283.1 unnamed protein product [Rotaria magnacalcarata]
MYLHLIQRGGAEIILSMEIKPRSATCSMYVRPLTVNNEGHPSGGEGLTNCEVEDEFLYESGTLPCHRDINSIEITVKIGGA